MNGDLSRSKHDLHDALAIWLVGGGEMGDVVRAKDWSSTPLGPIKSWAQSLRTAVSLCLSSNFPINIIWGREHTQIYNDGYRVVCGAVHPRALGEDYSVTRGECLAGDWRLIRSGARG